MITFYSLSALINAITSTALGIFIFSRKKSNVNVSFSLFSLSVAFWSYAYFFWQIAQTDTMAILWCKILTVGSIFIPLFYLRFTLFFLGEEKKKYNNALLYFGYLLAVVFLVISPTSLLVDGVSEKLAFKFWPNAGGLYWFFILMFSGFAAYSLILYYKFFKIAVGSSREQIKLVLLGTGVGFLGGATNFLLWYNVLILPIGNIFVSLYVVLVFYAIVAHRLMDIKLALRRSIVYILSVLAVAVPASGLLYLVNQFWPQYTTYVAIAALVASVSVFSPIRDYYYRIANKYFFSSLYDSREVIARVSDGLRSTLDIAEIYNFISQILISSLHAKAVSILNYDLVKREYVVQFNNGFVFNGRKNFPGNSGLQEEDGNQSRTLVVEEIKSIAHNQYKEIIDLLVSVDVAAVVPLNVKNEALGVIFLGPKESGDMYNDEDLRTLETIASQAAMAIKNAQLYDEAKGFSMILQKEVERQTRELKQANEDLTKLDKAKSDFISIASHQLRTPLTAIKGFTSMMLEGSYGRITNVVKDKLEKVSESAERLIRLVNDLLDLSHMEGGKMEFNFQKVNLTQMTKSVCEELEIQAQKKKLKLTVNLAERDLFVKADEQKLRQVVMNLIDNAVKYTDKGKTEVSLKEIDNKIQFSVKDTGLGMKPEEIANLFQKFVRGSEASHYHTEGAGIGLYVARQLIEAHQGRVWAESEGEDKGSTFFVEMAEWKD